MDGEGRDDHDEEVNPAQDEGDPSRHCNVPTDIQGPDPGRQLAGPVYPAAVFNLIYLHKAYESAGEHSLETSDHTVHDGDNPHVLPVGPRLADLHHQSNAGGPEMEDRVDDDRPQKREPPYVSDVQQYVRKVLGRPEQRWKGRSRVICRYRIGITSAEPGESDLHSGEKV